MHLTITSLGQHKPRSYTENGYICVKQSARRPNIHSLDSIMGFPASPNGKTENNLTWNGKFMDEERQHLHLGCYRDVVLDHVNMVYDSLLLFSFTFHKNLCISGTFEKH